jgi:hypothetical protein
VPVVLCATADVDAVKARARDVLGHVDFSPNYERLLQYGDAEDVDDVMACGDESAIVARLERYRDEASHAGRRRERVPRVVTCW